MSSFDALNLFQNLKVGDRIDVQDQEGDWFDAVIRNIVDNKLICHFWGFANIWDTTIEFNPSKIASVHTYSESSNYEDHEKLLGECVWEVLSIKNLLNEHHQCTNEGYVSIQKESGILIQDMRAFLENMDASDDTHRSLCKYVQKHTIEQRLRLRIQELLENGAHYFGFDEQIESNMKTIENINDEHNIKNKSKLKCIIEPLNLENLSKIELPDIADVICTNGINTVSATNPRKRKQSPHCAPHRAKKKQKVSKSKITQILVTKYDENSVKKGWMDIPSKEELLAGIDGKYRCSSMECLDKAPFKTYTTTVRHIMVEHQGYRYRCDFCREAHSTEVEFRSHSSLKIHLSNHHKLTKDDFQKFRIVLVPVGENGIAKKTQCSDSDEFESWRKKVIFNDKKRNEILTENQKQVLKKIGGENDAAIDEKCEDKKKLIHEDDAYDAATNGVKEEEEELMRDNIKERESLFVIQNEFELKSISKRMENDLGLNLDNNNNNNNNNNNAARTRIQVPKVENTHKDKAFMDRIDELIQNLETEPKKADKMKKKKREKRKRNRGIPYCDICGRTFKNFQGLGGHKKTHLSNNIDNNERNAMRARRRRRRRRIRNCASEDSDYNEESEIDEDEDDFYSDDDDDEDNDIDDDLNVSYECAAQKYKKQLKRLPFGPCWRPNEERNIFQESKSEWIDVRNKKMSLSKKFGCVILHFAEYNFEMR